MYEPFFRRWLVLLTRYFPQSDMRGIAIAEGDLLGISIRRFFLSSFVTLLSPTIA